jgi:hypothetical protein
MKTGSSERVAIFASALRLINNLIHKAASRNANLDSISRDIKSNKMLGSIFVARYQCLVDFDLIP